MGCNAADRHSHDILSKPLLTFLLYGIPIIAIIAGGSANIGTGWRTAIWTAALAVLGIACIANAMRCGRMHCYFTGPFFLAMALLSLLYGVGVLPLGRQGWNIVSAALLVGAILLCCLPEFLWGNYKASHR
jgi:hypothetical protein